MDIRKKTQCFLLTGWGYGKRQDYISTSGSFKKKTEMQTLFSNVEHDPEAVEPVFKDVFMPLCY